METEWQRFLRANKGKGKSMKQLSKEYHALKKKGGNFLTNVLAHMFIP